MKIKPVISFVMLTWNRKAFVELCMKSFFENLSYKYKFEFLIVDNGSNDGSVSLLKEYAKKENQIKITFCKRNKGLNAYKYLLFKSKGEYIIIVDDDVIEFPPNFDYELVNCLLNARDFGYIALDVVQNEYTNGAKPSESFYVDIQKRNVTISEGPTGGWCTIFRRKDFKKISWKFYLKRLNMKNGEDGVLSNLLKTKLSLKSGLLKGIKCLHASGAYYSEKFGHLERDIKKYTDAGLSDHAANYQSKKNNS